MCDLYRFVTSCVDSDGRSINDMQDRAVTVGRRTFLKYVDRDDLKKLEKQFGYDTGVERGGLRMSNDWHVSYARSIYRGRPCYYFVHSAIEYIFCPGKK